MRSANLFRCPAVIATGVDRPLTLTGHFVYIDIVTGSEFRKLRKDAGFSQAKLGRELDIAVRTMTRWERGETPIPRMAVLAVRYLIATKNSKGVR
jgi:DNA-binding transcriptional regulator YiaG